MEAFSLWHWLIVVVILFVYIWPISRILKKAGFSPWWSLLAILWPIGVIGAWVLAYVRWPHERDKRRA